jgi:hypothetical protein
MMPADGAARNSHARMGDDERAALLTEDGPFGVVQVLVT